MYVFGENDDIDISFVNVPELLRVFEAEFGGP